jgi:DNA-binding transcriptional regulator YiaG
VFSEITRKYRRYLIAPQARDDSELVDWFTSDVARGIEKDMTPGKALRHLREMCDLTLEEVGENVGVSAQRVHDWESGERSISKNKAKGLSKLFNCGAEQFI